MALTLSILALAATCYQLYLQRRHNEKSLQPLVQIDVCDFDNLIAVRVRNNGLGPFVIERLSFTSGAEACESIRPFISLDPKSYHNVPVSKDEKKVILPDSYLDVFSIRLNDGDAPELAATIKQELSLLTLKVEGRDIYDNRITCERKLDWFAKYLEI